MGARCSCPSPSILLQHEIGEVEDSMHMYTTASSFPTFQASNIWILLFYSIYILQPANLYSPER